MRNPPSRREYLRWAGLAALSGVAGCLDDKTAADRATETDIPSRTESSRPSPSPTEPPTATATEYPTPVTPRPSEFVRIGDLSLEGNATTGAFYDVVDTGDQIVCGGTIDGALALVAFDDALTVEWAERYSDWRQVDEDQTKFRLLRSSDGGFLLGGRSSSSNDTFVALETDSRGDVTWSRTFEVDIPSHVQNVWTVETTNDTYVTVISKGGPNSLRAEVQAFDDPDGPLRWNKTFDEIAFDYVAATANGGCFFEGYEHHGGPVMGAFGPEDTERWTHYGSFLGGREVEEGYVLWEVTDSEQLDVEALDDGRRSRWQKTYDLEDINGHAVCVGPRDRFSIVTGGRSRVSELTIDVAGDVVSRTRAGVAPDQDAAPTAIDLSDERRTVTGVFGESHGPIADAGWVAIF